LSDGSPRERASPMTPTLLTRSSPGKACQIARYSPALRMPLRKTASALRRMSSLGRVTSKAGIYRADRHRPERVLGPRFARTRGPV
jgi:hypothetical protein